MNYFKNFFGGYRTVEIKLGSSEAFKISDKELTITKSEKTLHVEEFVPNVIEPSFGIGRVLYAIFEHNFKVRAEDNQRTVRNK